MRRSFGVRSGGLIGTFWVVSKRCLRGFGEILREGGEGELEGLGVEVLRILGRRRWAGS